MERTVVDLNKARRQRVAVWTPWGVVPTEMVRKKGDCRPVRDKRGPRENDRRAPERLLAS